MSMDSTTKPPRRGFLARFFGGIRDRFRRMFGKKSDDPNIYPFY